jgi:hypothetical protein
MYNSMMSNILCLGECWPVCQPVETPANEMRSLHEQRRAWIKEIGKINTWYSRRAKIMRGYIKVKSCSQG